MGKIKSRNNVKPIVETVVSSDGAVELLEKVLVIMEDRHKDIHTGRAISYIKRAIESLCLRK